MDRTADIALRSTCHQTSRKGGTASSKDTSISGSSCVSSDRDDWDYLFNKDRSELNPICPRGTPSWQKPITNFFTTASKSVSESNKKPIDDGTGSSNIASVVNEISASNMNDINSKYQQAVMEQDVDESPENKENNSLNENVTDTEMKEFNDAKREHSDDDDELLVPPKRIRLNKEVYKHLKTIEQRIHKF